MNFRVLTCNYSHVIFQCFWWHTSVFYGLLVWCLEKFRLTFTLALWICDTLFLESWPWT
jgi:hypothetical protein